MAPVFQRPLDVGADICMTSMTKFIGGHSDLTGGILSVKGKDLSDRIYFTQVLNNCKMHQAHAFCSYLACCFMRGQNGMTRVDCASAISAMWRL